jgi:hypothetical protein
MFNEVSYTKIDHIQINNSGGRNGPNNVCTYE